MPLYEAGHWVWLLTKHLPLKLESRKLAPCFVGPFPFSKVTNPVSVRLNLLRSFGVHPTFHVSKIQPVRTSHLDLPFCLVNLYFCLG